MYKASSFRTFPAVSPKLMRNLGKDPLQKASLSRALSGFPCEFVQQRESSMLNTTRLRVQTIAINTLKQRA